MGVSILHTANFSLGEIDARLFSRVDFAGYFKGAALLRNVMVLPQGGVTRRFGTKFSIEAKIATSASEIRIVILEYQDLTRYLCVFENISLKIYREGNLIATLVSPYTVDQLQAVKFGHELSALISVHGFVPPYRLVRGTVETDWTFAPATFKNKPVYDFNSDYDAVTFTPSGTTGSTITITATGGTPFTTSHVNGLFFGNEGTLRIDTYTDSTHVVGHTISDFKNTTGIKGTDALLTEPIWSNSRGWPQCVTFYQSRAVYAKTYTLPQSICLSKTNKYFDCDDSNTLDDSGMTLFANTGRSNIVLNILGSEVLWAFTATSVLATPNLQTSPLTPTTAALLEQSSYGISSNIDPVYFDNQIFYVDRGGKIVWSLTYDIQRQSFIPNDASLVSQHLINNPVSVGVMKHPVLDFGNYLAYVNEDGTMSILQSMQTQNVMAWTLSTTDGYFRQIESVGNEGYVVVERTINGVKKFYIEQIDFTERMDCVITQTSDQPLTVVNHLGKLEGKTVQVIGDDYILNDQVVTNGKITIERPSYVVKVGLAFEPQVRPMPPHSAQTFYNDKHIQSIYVGYYQSLGIYVNDQPLKDIQDAMTMDILPVPRTGVERVPVLQNVNDFNSILITQYKPLPFTILSIGTAVQVSPLK